MHNKTIKLLTLAAQAATILTQDQALTLRKCRCFRTLCRQTQELGTSPSSISGAKNIYTSYVKNQFCQLSVSPKAKRIKIQHSVTLDIETNI